MSEIQRSPFRVILLAASMSAGEDQKKYSGRRDQVAKMLPPEKLMEAQRMTREWEKSHPRKLCFDNFPPWSLPNDAEILEEALGIDPVEKSLVDIQAGHFPTAVRETYGYLRVILN